jgi:hypothetical protein
MNITILDGLTKNAVGNIDEPRLRRRLADQRQGPLEMPLAPSRCHPPRRSTDSGMGPRPGHRCSRPVPGDLAEQALAFVRDQPSTQPRTGRFAEPRPPATAPPRPSKGLPRSYDASSDQIVRVLAHHRYWVAAPTADTTACSPGRLTRTDTRSVCLSCAGPSSGSAAAN